MTQDSFLLLLLLGLAVLVYRVSTLSSKLDRVQQQLDLVLSNFNGLREYLYEIDPQFDDERQSDQELNDGENLLAGWNDLSLLNKKEKEGRRTLGTPFHRRNGA